MSEEKEEVVEEEADNRKKSEGIRGAEGEGRIILISSNFRRLAPNKTLEEFEGDPGGMTSEQ